MFGRTAEVATVADFDVWRLVGSRFRFVLPECIQRPFASATPRALKRFDSGNERAGDEHQLKIEGSRDVLNGRETRVDRRALEIGDLSLSQAHLAGQLLLTELLPAAGVAEYVGYRQRRITDTGLNGTSITIK